MLAVPWMFAALALAPEPDLVEHPWMDLPRGPLVLDVADAHQSGTLDLAARQHAPPVPPLPDGASIDPEPAAGWLDIPGNEYPRKHTVYLNFGGAMLTGGKDNSAENKASMAKHGPYPAFTGTEAQALATIEAYKQDVARYGIRVVHEERPNKRVPYTMVMIGGDWTNTTLEEPAGGVASTADCEARGQRHVVFTFANGYWSSARIANISAQETGHAWGLDHSQNCDSVMSYCSGEYDQWFSDTCDSLCEAGCGSAAGCRPTHEIYCGDGSDRQNEDAELSYIFGINDPDTEPPEVTITQPGNGDVLPTGATAKLRAAISDNFGGVGWELYIEHDGEVLLDGVDYAKENVDDVGNAAVNLVSLIPGTYTFRVTAEDHADHVVSDEIVFHVADDGATTSGSGGTTGGTAGGGDDSDGTETDGGDPTGPPDSSSTGLTGLATGDTAGTSTDDGGCACSANGGPGGVVGLLLLPLLRWRRRRA